MRAQDIRRRQKQHIALRLQAATRQKATQSKRLRRLDWTATWLITAAGPVGYFWFDWSTDVAASAAAVWLLVSRLAIRPFELAWRRESASLADRYDTFVLGLSPSSNHLLQRVSDEEANSAADRYVRRQDWEARIRRNPRDPYARLRDWFDVPSHLQDDALVLGCQRGGAEYARRLAGEWARICTATWVFLIVLSIIIGIVTELSLSEYLVVLALPWVPAVLGLIDGAELHWQGATSRAQVVESADRAIRDRATVAIPIGLTRSLADQAWLWRSTDPGAPDLYYRLRRARLDADSAAAAGSRI